MQIFRKKRWWEETWGCDTQWAYIHSESSWKTFLPSSNAETYIINVHRLSELPSGKNMLRTREGFLKPVFISTCNGSPDDTPRYEPVTFSQHFKDFVLNTTYINTNALGRSALIEWSDGMRRYSRWRLIREGLLAQPVLMKQTSKSFVPLKNDGFEDKFALLLLEQSLGLQNSSYLK